MAESRLIELSYYDPKAETRLTAYADTIVLDHNEKGGIISAIRFGGYPEVVRALSDAIYGGSTIEATQNDTTHRLQSKLRGYQRQLGHDGIYATATLMANDDEYSNEGPEDQEDSEEAAGTGDGQQTLQPRKCYIFCPAGDRDRLFEELDEKMDAWVLELRPNDENVVQVLEDGLKSGQIAIPGAVPGAPDGFEQVENVTSYLNTFGVTVADRIRNQFLPLFDPASEPLSEEVLAINDCIQQRAGYSLYDAQLAVAEAVKRQLERNGTAIIIAECGSGKTNLWP